MSSQPAHGIGDQRHISPLSLHLRTLNPQLGIQVPPEEDTNSMLLLGADRSTLDVRWKSYKKLCDEMVDALKMQRTLGEKPHDGDASVQYYHIPVSAFAIRVWDGAMQQHGQYCFDLYDTTKRTALNLPSGYTICRVPDPGVEEMGRRIISWEKAAQMEPGVGQEKFSDFENSRLVLRRPGHPPFYFKLPGV